MAEQKKGFVKRTFKKEGTSSKGDWYAYSFKIEDTDGNEDSFFYQLGFNKPLGPIKEGVYLEFDAEPKDDRAMTVVEGSGKLPKNPPARKASSKSSGGGGGGRGRGGPQTKTSELFGEIGGYNTEDDIRRMSYSAARDAAVQLVVALLANDALPMSAAKNKGGQAKRFDEILAQADKLTVEFFYDSATGRKLDTVADSGTVNTAADGDVPDKEEQQDAPEPEDKGDDAPPPADDSEADSNGSF